MKNLVKLLQRRNHYELSGNKMTAYAPGLGGGSIHFWNGKRSSFCSTEHPLTQKTAFMEVRNKSGCNLLHLMNHRWLPEYIENQFHSHHRIYINEKKTIFDDVFVSVMRFKSEVTTEVDLLLLGEGYESCDLEIIDNSTIAIREYYSAPAHCGDEAIKPSHVHKFIRMFGGSGGKWELPVHPAYLWREKLQLNDSRDSTEDSSKVFILLVSADSDRQVALEKLDKYGVDPERILEYKALQNKQFWEENVPEFSCDSEEIERLYYYLNYLIKSNIYEFGSGYFQESFESTGKFRLNAQWFWDSAFGAISEKYLNGLAYPRSTMLNTLFAQREDGMLPFALCEDDYLYGARELTQPWILPIAIWDYFLKSNDVDFLRTALPRLTKFDSWLMQNRSPRGDNLINIKVPGESGWDNSARYIFSGFMVQEQAPMIANNRYMQSPDFNTYLYIGRKIISKIAAVTGDEALSMEYAQKAGLTAAGIRSMWSEETGLFMDRFEDNYSTSNVLSPGGIIPLMMGLCEDSQVHKIVNNLTDPEKFWSKYPVMTLAKTDPSFRTDDDYFSYWNGRVWPQINWLIIEGLFMVGEIAVARELCQRSLRMAMATGEPECQENYHPETGEPFFTHNTLNYVWGGIYYDILLRRVMGIEFNAPADQLTIAPLWIESVHRMEIKNLAFGTHSIDVCLKRIGNDDEAVLELTHRGQRFISVILSSGKFSLLNDKITSEVKYFKHKHWLEL